MGISPPLSFFQFRREKKREITRLGDCPCVPRANIKCPIISDETVNLTDTWKKTRYIHRHTARNRVYCDKKRKRTTTIRPILNQSWDFLSGHFFWTNNALDKGDNCSSLTQSIVLIIVVGSQWPVCKKKLTQQCFFQPSKSNLNPKTTKQPRFLIDYKHQQYLRTWGSQKKRETK